MYFMRALNSLQSSGIHIHSPGAPQPHVMLIYPGQGLLHSFCGASLEIGGDVSPHQYSAKVWRPAKREPLAEQFIMHSLGEFPRSWVRTCLTCLEVVAHAVYWQCLLV
jgi:hypothetical protein